MERHKSYLFALIISVYNLPPGDSQEVNLKFVTDFFTILIDIEYIFSIILSGKTSYQ